MKYFAHKLCLLIAHLPHRVHETAPAFQTWRSQSSFSVNLPWTACGFVWCNVSISPSSPAPTSSTNLNSNNDKTYRVTPMIESLRTKQLAFFRFATPSGFLGRGGGAETTYKKYSWVSARENHMKPFVRTSFLGTRPSFVPSPGRRFFQATENRIYNWAALKRGSPVITRLFIFGTNWLLCGTNWLLCGTNWLLIGMIWPRNEMTGYLSCLGYRKALAIYHVKCHIWNEVTFLWNELAIDWNDLTTERNNQIPVLPWVSKNPSYLPR